MRSMLKVGMLALTVAAMPIVAQAGILEGIVIGVGTGALVAGPPGAVVGAVVGGPDVVEPQYGTRCWINRDGYRRCAWR